MVPWLYICYLMEKVKTCQYTHPPIEAVFKLIFFLCYYLFFFFSCMSSWRCSTHPDWKLTIKLYDIHVPIQLFLWHWVVGQGVGSIGSVFKINEVCTDFHWFSPMEFRQTVLKYRVEREVLDEQHLEEVAQRKAYSDTHHSITDWLKESLR